MLSSLCWYILTLKLFISRRLAGKAAKRREFEDMKIIDINEADMRGDPNVWLTKVGSGCTKTICDE